MTRNDIRRTLKTYYDSSDPYLRRMSAHGEAYFRPLLNMISRFAHTGSGRLLDVGCGAGVSTFLIAGRFPGLSVLGVDLSSKFIEHARGRFKADNLAYQQMDACEISLPDESVDVVVSQDMVEHLPHPEAFLAGSHRILRPGGLFILLAPNLLNPLGPMIAVLRRQRWRGRKLSVLSAAARSVGLFRLYFSKRLGRGYTFTNANPVLDDSIQVGADADAVYLSNPLDLRAYFREKRYEILNLLNPVTHKQKLIRAVCRYWAPVGLAARKPPVPPPSCDDEG